MPERRLEGGQQTGLERLEHGHSRCGGYNSGLDECGFAHMATGWRKQEVGMLAAAQECIAEKYSNPTD